MITSIIMFLWELGSTFTPKGEYKHDVLLPFLALFCVVIGLLLDVAIVKFLFSLTT